MACQDRGGGAGEEVAYELGFAVFDRGRDGCFGREDGETGVEGVGEECLAGTFGCCWLLLLLLCTVFGSGTFRHLLITVPVSCGVGGGESGCDRRTLWSGLLSEIFAVRFSHYGSTTSTGGCPGTAHRARINKDDDHGQTRQTHVETSGHRQHTLIQIDVWTDKISSTVLRIWNAPENQRQSSVYPDGRQSR